MPTAEIYCAAHRSVSDDTRKSLEMARLPFRLIVGISDTALARNITLTQAVQSEADVIVMVDDDMVIPPECMHKLIEIAHREQVPTSGLYLTGKQQAAAYPLAELGDYLASRWVTGLGALAIPMPRLRELRDKSEVLRGDPDDVIEFCWSGAGALPHDDPKAKRRWLSEDYCLTLRLGGCILAPVGVGHQKTIALWPDEASLRNVKAGMLTTATTSAE